MKRFFYFLFLISIYSYTSCNHTSELQLSDSADSLNISIKSTNLFDVEDATLSDFVNAQKKYISNFIADTLKIKKQNNELILPLSNNKNIIYKDTLSPETDDTDYRFYKYLGSFPEIGFYLVQAGFYEDALTYLIDVNTGKETVIGGFPKFSPKQNYFVNINDMGGMGDELIGYQIWRFNKTHKSMKLIYEFDQFEWFPIDFVWEDDNTLIIKVISFKSKEYQDGINYMNSKVCVYKRLKLKS